MRRFLRVCAVLVAAASAVNVHADRLEGHIVAVGDGDTVTLRDAEHRQHKIRLNGIDAPELGQPFGRTARQHLYDLVANRQVVAHCVKTDRYGREVCQVWVDSIDAGLAQIRAGLAWYFERYAHDLELSNRQTYSLVEAQARTDGKGLWTDPQPVAPWNWRSEKKVTQP